MSYTSVRISAMSTDTVEIFNKFMSDKAGDRAFLVREKAGEENEHYHVILPDTEHSEAYSKKFKRFFVKENEAYKDVGRGGKRKIFLKSYPISNISSGYKYLCKGKEKGIMPEVMVNDCITDDEIEEFHYAYWEEREEHETGQIQESKKKPNKVQEYLLWFEEFKLYNYYREYSQEYVFNAMDIGKDIMEFFNLSEERPMLHHKRLIEMYMCLTYNRFVRKYAEEQFKKYQQRYIMSIGLFDFGVDV